MQVCCWTSNLYIVICIERRGDPAQILGIEMGEALVPRNVGRRVAHAVVTDVFYAAPAGAGRWSAW